MNEDLKQIVKLHDENIELKKEIERLKGEREWISVKDRLPENDDDYLIIHRKFNRPETDIIEVFSYENNEWWDDGYEFKTNPDYRTVIYWMPLPEKPKE